MNGRSWTLAGMNIIQMQERYRNTPVFSDRELGLEQTQLPAPTLKGRRVISLKNDCAIFAPFADATVQTPNGAVDIDAKSVVLVFATENSTAVFCLDDQHRDAVIVLGRSRYAIIEQEQCPRKSDFLAVATIL